jgi:membrane protein YdbS with pleckstrin-like domain
MTKSKLWETVIITGVICFVVLIIAFVAWAVFYITSYVNFWAGLSLLACMVLLGIFYLFSSTSEKSYEGTS